MKPVRVEGGAAEVLDAERASAMPAPPPAPTRQRRAAPPARALPLAESQAWFLDAITFPGTLPGGARAAARAHGATFAELFVSTPTLDARTRLGVYHYAHRTRLVEALADDYPAVRHALGAEAFAELAAHVITRFPSRTPNLNHYGRALLDFLDGRGGRVPHRPFLRELARLEWALVEVIHAPAPARLSPDALRAIPPERWPQLRFRGSPSLRLLPSPWPANAYLQAFRRGENPPLPSRRRSATLVVREGVTVWRMDLSPLTQGLLAALLAGVPLGEALDAIEGRAGAGQVMRWFEMWVSGGVFAAVE